MNEVGPENETLEVLPLDVDAPRRRREAPRREVSGSIRWLIAGVAAFIVGLIATDVVFGGDGGEEAAAPEEPVIDGDRPTGEPAIETTPETPSGLRGLLDGQRLVVATANLPGSVETVTVMCRVATPPQALTELDSCDSGTAQRGTTSPGGSLEIEFDVFRTISTGRAGDLDCVLGGCELRTYSDRVAGVGVRIPLEFEMVRQVRRPPSFRVEFDGRLTVGSRYRVIGDGFPADTSIHIRPCRMAVDPDPFACDWVLEDTVIQTESDGTFAYTGLADWEIGFGADAITCADVVEGICAMNVSIPGAQRQPAAVPLDFSPFGSDPSPLPDTLAVQPSTGLVDGATVTVSSDDGTYDGEFGLFVCADDAIPIDCTGLDFRGLIDDGAYQIPRAFVTWRGTRHDCVLTGPCSLAVFSQTDPSDRRTVPIDFDPDAPLQPDASLTLSPSEELQDWSLLTIDLDQPASFPIVSLCAVGASDVCEAVGSDLIGPTQLVTRARTTLTTPAGAHSCLFDGACELIVWDVNTLTRYAAVPLSFEAPNDRPVSGVARPATGIEHGDTVQVAVFDAIDDVSVSMCRRDGKCTPIVVVDTNRGRAAIEFTAMQRFDTPLSAGTSEPIDCTVDGCEIRISDGRTNAVIPVDFVNTEVLDAAITADAAQPLPLDERFDIRGRGFTPTVQRSEITLSLCPPGDEDPSVCVRLGTIATNSLGAGGRFEKLVNIASTGFSPEAVSQGNRCASDCVLVARPDYGTTVRLPVQRDVS
ncbi:MAG: hypothetical protein AAGA37_16595 [Actinomycetota bacterium]